MPHECRLLRRPYFAFAIWYLMGTLIMATSSQTACGQMAAAEPSGAQPAAAGYEEIAERLRSAIRLEVANNELPAFSIALVDDDRTVWAEGFGFQDSAGETPATADTVYRVGSVSKLFTDIAVMQLVEQQQLDLDVPVTDYVPKFQPHNPQEKPKPITLRQLMSHTSGLVREPPVGHYFDPDEPTLQATVESLNRTKLVYPPETKTKYSNAGIAVVGAVLEKHQAKPFAQSIDESILQPLDMQQSGFELSSENQRRLATGWMWSYDGRRFEAPTWPLGTSPAGNLYASVADLGKFLVAVFQEGRTAQGKILRPETLHQMLTRQNSAPGKPTDYGIGFSYRTV